MNEKKDNNFIRIPIEEIYACKDCRDEFLNMAANAVMSKPKQKSSFVKGLEIIKKLFFILK